MTRSSLVVLTRVRSRCCVPPAASRDPPARPASSSGRAPRSCRTRREVDGCGSHVTRIWSGSSLGRAAPQPNDGGAEAARGESRRRADCPTSGRAPHGRGVCTEDMLARGRGIAARGARETAGRGCSCCSHGVTKEFSRGSRLSSVLSERPVSVKQRLSDSRRECVVCRADQSCLGGGGERDGEEIH